MGETENRKDALLVIVCVSIMCLLLLIAYLQTGMFHKFEEPEKEKEGQAQKTVTVRKPPPPKKHSPFQVWGMLQREKARHQSQDNISVTENMDKDGERIVKFLDGDGDEIMLKECWGRVEEWVNGKKEIDNLEKFHVDQTTGLFTDGLGIGYIPRKNVDSVFLRLLDFFKNIDVKEEIFGTMTAATTPTTMNFEDY